jgi:dihydrofolate reductase
MKAIIAVNNLGYIGKNNALIWYSSEDLKHFKNLTKDSVCLVGYRTYSSLPELKNRTIMIDSRGQDRLGWDWCIGGKKTYEKYCQYFDELHISYIDNNSIGDVMFPDLKNLKTGCKIYKYYFKAN